jgi:tRNA(Ile)-lysidine synthase
VIDRFRDDVIAMLGHDPDRPLALAVSGGPDSMAMLALTAAAFPGAVIAATVDHRLRAESTEEAAMVAAYCGRAGIPHAILTPDDDWRPRTVQADARQLRYALLGEWATAANAAALLTAHHADVQAETFLMRAAWQRDRWHRGDPGSGAAGESDSISVIRPLLTWRRAELARVVAAMATPFVTDPSNTDDRFDRVRMRALLAQHAGIDAAAIAQAAAACAEADAAMTAMVTLLHRERLRDTSASERSYDVTDLPREFRRRLAREAIRHVRGAGEITEGRWSDATNVESLLDALAAGGRATLAGVLAVAQGEIWTFAKAPPRRSH